MVNVGDYIAVKYDNSWWIGVILKAAPEDELLVKFMHPSGPWQTFYWPKHDDILQSQKLMFYHKFLPRTSADILVFIRSLMRSLNFCQR